MNRLAFVSIAIVALVGRVGAQEVPLEFGGATMQFQLAIGSDSADPFAPVMTFAQVDPGLPTELPSLVRLPRVVDDLQLSDSQVAEIRERFQETTAKFQRRREELASKFGEAGQQAPEFVDAANKLNESQKKELLEIVKIVLLPHQQDRLQQISTQAKLTAHGSNSLDELADELELTDEQRKKLTELAEGFEEEFREEVRELRRKRQREMLESVLTDSQEKKLVKLLGDDLAKEQSQTAGDQERR
jgi:hypothetical protein